MNSARVIVGNGSRKVICLHGWFGSARGWGPFVDSLDKSAFTYAFTDYRGYGARNGEKGEFTIKEIANDTSHSPMSSVGNRSASWVTRWAAWPSNACSPMPLVASRSSSASTPCLVSGVPFDDAGWGFFSSAAESAESRYGIIDLTTGKRLTKTWVNAMVEHSLANSTKEAFAALPRRLGENRLRRRDPRQRKTLPRHRRGT